MNQRFLTQEEQLELDGLNEAIRQAIEVRSKWLDVKMVECSEIKVGDKIYDLKTGRYLGVVKNLYRYWQDRDEGIRDTSSWCDYEYERPDGCIDNTSSQIGLIYGKDRETTEKLRDEIRNILLDRAK